MLLIQVSIIRYENVIVK